MARPGAHPLIPIVLPCDPDSERLILSYLEQLNQNDRHKRCMGELEQHYRFRDLVHELVTFSRVRDVLAALIGAGMFLDFA